MLKSTHERDRQNYIIILVAQNLKQEKKMHYVRVYGHIPTKGIRM